jgi:hypothetical protein
MELKGIFKDFDGLKAAYGFQDTDPATGEPQTLDPEFESFLKKISGQETILAAYEPHKKTFNTTLIIEDPERPGSGIKIQTTLDGRSRRYGDNMGIDKLDSVTKTGADEYIYCTNPRCGFTVGKDVPYYYEPSFTFGMLYDGNCDSPRDPDGDNPTDRGSKTLNKIIFKACDGDQRIFCPECLSHQKFDEIGNTLP